jgi:Fur family transcriptional regulator, ferric uptake regulator
LILNLIMKSVLKILGDHIRKNGLKDTSQREEVLSYLVGIGGHRTSEEIYDALRRRNPGIGRATVFRTLKLLESCGLAAKVLDAEGRSRYEFAYGRPSHDHMICVECGALTEFSSPAIEAARDRAAKSLGFRVLWRRHELFGRCRRCSAGRSHD